MREQVKLLKKIMHEVLHHPHNGTPTYFTVNYEVFYVVDAILNNQPINPSITKHMTDEQINVLHAAQITQDDVREVQQQSGASLDLLYTILGDLMTENNLLVSSASYEIWMMFATDKAQAYAGDYREKIKNSNITEVDFNYFSLAYREEAMRGMRLWTNIPPRLAIKKLRQCTEEQVKEQWWAAKSTRLELQAMLLAHLSNGLNATTLTKNIMDYVNNDKPGSLTESQQKVLKEKFAPYVIYQFDQLFMADVYKQYKMQLLDADLKRWPLTFAGNVTQFNDSSRVIQFLAAHDSFMDCYQYNRCKSLFSQPHLKAALANRNATTYTQPSNATLSAAVPEFFRSSRAYLDNAYAVRHELSSSFVLLASSFVMDNPVAYEVGAIVVLSMFLFRHKIARLNPFQYFSRKPAVNDQTTVEELERLTTR